MTTVIYCVNNSTALKNSDMILMISALNTLLPAFCTSWSQKQYTVALAPTNFRATGLYCIFADTADIAGCDITQPAAYDGNSLYIVTNNKGIVVYDIINE
jgi:hypothetical protein